MPEPLDVFREWLTKKIANQGQVYEQIHRAEPRIRGDYIPPFERGYLKALKDLLEEIFQCLEGTPSQSKSRQETLCSQNRAEDPSD